jgi:hypothetical protein
MGGVRGNGFCEDFVGSCAEFTIHHVRAIICRYHGDGHLTFVVVITFRVIIVIIDIHAISNNLFQLHRTARCLSFCRLHHIGWYFLDANWRAAAALLRRANLNCRLGACESRGLRSYLREIRSEEEEDVEEKGRRRREVLVSSFTATKSKKNVQQENQQKTTF